MTLIRLSYFNRPAYQLKNDRLCLTVVPAFSGRVMELLVDGHNCLWTNVPLLKGEVNGDPTFGNWMNWGGYKTWLGPQSRWPDPGSQSDEMDNVEWEVVDQTPTAIELLGPPIPWAGVRLGRRLSLAAARGEPRVHVLESIANTSDVSRSWAVWAVTQFPVPYLSARRRAPGAGASGSRVRWRLPSIRRRHQVEGGGAHPRRMGRLPGRFVGLHLPGQLRRARRPAAARRLHARDLEQFRP
jgi:hypothetical protein